MATYSVSDGVDLLVTATARGVSTKIRVNSPDAVVPAFEVEVRTVGTELTKAASGRLLIADQDSDELVAKTAVLLAWDARRDAYGDPLKVARVEASVEQKARVGDRIDHELTLSVPRELVDDPEVVYPIIIDPDLSPFGPEQDSWAREGVGWVSALDYRLLVGASQDHANSNPAVSLVQWNDGRIRNRNISNAEVGFFQYMAASCSAKRVNIHQVLSPWSEQTLTWANKPGVSTAPATSSSFTRNLGGSGCTPAGGFVTADVTGLVQAWADGASNVGMQLSVPDANKNDFSFERRLCSIDYDTSHTACDRASRTPYLKFTYTNRAPYAPDVPRVVGSWMLLNMWWINQASPTFTTRPIGVWGSTLQVSYEVWVAGSSILAGTCTTGWVSSWQDASCVVPYLAPGGRVYVVRAKATDNSGLAGPWSGWTHFGVVDPAGPNVPTEISFSGMTQPAVTNTPTPILSSKVSLPAGQACVWPVCLWTQFKVTKPGGATMELAGVTAVSGGYSAVTVTAPLEDFTTYSITARTISEDGGLISDWSPPVTMVTRFDTAPGAVASPAVLNANGDTLAGATPVAGAGSLKFKAAMPAGRLCPGETPDCLRAEFTVKDSSGVVRWGSSVFSAQPGEEITTGVVDASNWAGGHTLSVRVWKSWASVWSTASRDFVVEMVPAQPVITIVEDGSAPPGAVKFRIDLEPVPQSPYVYQWDVAYTADDSGKQHIAGSVEGASPTDVVVQLPLAPGEFAEVEVAVYAALAAPNQAVVGPTAAIVGIPVFG